MPLKNSQFEQLMREYSRRQLDNLHDQRRRAEEVYAGIPEMKELEDSLITLSAERTRRRIETGVPDPELEQQIRMLRARRLLLLENAGFPADYLEVHYRCPDCRDTGYIGNEKCHCFRQAAIDLLYSQSNLQDVLASENFNTLSLDFYPKDQTHPRTGQTIYDYMKQVADRCRAYAYSFGREKGSLLFTGTTGVGKTFLSNCIAKELIDRCYSVVYLTATELFDLFSRDAFRYDEVADDEISQYILESDLLIIDDLGTEVSNSFTNSKLFYCINERLLRHRGTIISTNLSLKELADAYTERVTSRILSAYQVIPLFGNDIRLARKFSGKP